MARIVAGSAGGVRLRVPRHGTRPTAERVREALFNALQAAGELDGAVVLDLFAGSGAMGLEALSRGAADVLFVESAPSAAEVLSTNIAAVGLGGAVRIGPVDAVLAQPPARRFDIVIADPPYDMPTRELSGTLERLTGWLAPHALVVVERSRRSDDIAWPAGYRPLAGRTYGDTVLHRAELS